MGYVLYYTEAHLACAFLLGFILYKIIRGVNKQLSQIYLANLIVVLMLYCFAEIFWCLVDAKVLGDSKTLIFLSNIFTYILLSIGSYFWFILSEVLQKDAYIQRETSRLIVSIPVWISSILCITAYRTGWVFYVDESGVLKGGKLYLILIIVPFGYLLVASIKALYRAFSRDRFADKNIYIMIGIFPFAPIVLGILQAIYWRIPFVCYGALAAVLYVYVGIMENMISLDPLTQINNRNQMYKYLVQKMKSEEPGMSLFLLIIDINRLRSINDAYGHSEGDKVIVEVAGAIKDACQGPRSRFFISRYGGDEFVVIAQMAYRAEATYLAEQIKTNVRRIPEKSSTSYDVSVSVGVAQYDYETPLPLEAFIARADSDLYKQKKIDAV